MQKNYYEVIGLNPSATQSEIEEACLAMATKYDPSRNVGDLKARMQFKEIEEAYQTIGSIKKRAIYDAGLSIPNPIQAPVYVPVQLTSPIVSTNCPACNSANVQRFSIIHSSGITDVNLVTKGSSIGIGAGLAKGGGMGVGVGLSSNKSKTKGTHQSELSKSVAPPPPMQEPGSDKAMLVALVTGIIFFIIFYTYDVGIVFSLLISICIIGVVSTYLNVKWVTQKQKDDALIAYSKVHTKWNNSFMCLSCGHKYERY